MLKTALFSVLALLFSGLAAAAENPLKKANVGDFVAFKQTTKSGMMNAEADVRQTVTKKSDTEVTIEYAQKIANAPEMKREIVVKLDEDYDPIKGPAKGAPKSTLKQLETGTEKITVNGKSLDTKWVLNEVTMKVAGQELTSKSKIWTCADVPLGGMVKMENDLGANGKSSMELTDFGSGK